MNSFLFNLMRHTGKLRLRLQHTPRPSSHPYLSGDTFRTFADHIHDETGTFNPQSVQINQIIFVKTDHLPTFFSEKHPYIPHPYTLITHNSDYEVGASEAAHIDEKITRWFAQNVTVAHPKITPIPIGLENLHWYKYGITKLFDKAQQNIPPKKYRILFNFTEHTNRRERLPALQTLRDIATADGIQGWLNPSTYLERLAAYAFVASPPGNGIDCIRTWEAQYVQTIPIVKRSVCTEHFKGLGLPMVLIDDWEELHTLDLEHVYTTLMDTADPTYLYADAWRDLLPHY